MQAQLATGNYKSGFRQEGNRFYFNTNNSKVIIEFCTPSMFRVRTTWTNKFEENEPWMVKQYNWPSVTTKSTENNHFFDISTSELQVSVSKSPFRIQVKDKNKKILSSDVISMYTNKDSVACTKMLRPGEHFFGFGERMDFLDQRNKQVKLNVGRGKGMPHIVGAYNVLEANYSPIPFFMSTNGYGIFFHNAFPTTWDMGYSSGNEYKFSATGGELDYYFIYGPKFQNILYQYTALTGRSPMVPKFALGLHVGTYSGGTWNYEQLTSDTYVIELARKLRELGIPVDILWLDSTWRIFGKVGGKGATSFEWRETFKNPRAMFDSLYKMNYSMVGLHLRPRFDNGNAIRLLDTARQLGFTYPENNQPGEFVNFFDSASVNFWWNHGVMRVASLGAKFLKTDEGSAFGGLANESEKTGPSGKEIQKLHNIFPLAYAKAPYEKFQEYNSLRGLNQTREGYAGIQRYPFIFAGDWPSEWQYFEPVIKAGLNIGLSGVGYWTHCMGGFEHPADPELYIRWCQFGMLSPIAMVFGMDHPGYKEPWNYGDTALRIFKKYDSLRYSLQPYLYNTAWQQYNTGMPMMRALVIDYQDDPNVYNITDQYMLGDALMVCPVTTKGAQTRVVYLPKGDWYDFHTMKKLDGGQWLNIVAPLDMLPMFVKAGSIIPRQRVMKYTDEKPADLIFLDIFPADSSNIVLYEDDGKSLDYQKGIYSETKLRYTASPKKIAINIQTPQGKYKPVTRNYFIKMKLQTLPGQLEENNQVYVEIVPDGRRALEDMAPGSLYIDRKNMVLYVKTVSNSDKGTNLSIIFP
jgi:alpha-glucosidase (family GH31 glycosyl hydrolase)